MVAANTGAISQAVVYVYLFIICRLSKALSVKDNVLMKQAVWRCQRVGLRP